MPASVRKRWVLFAALVVALVTGITHGLTTGRGDCATGVYSDVITGHRYSEAIQDLTHRQIIEGFSDGTFRPESRVTRQQFVKMLLLALSFPVSEEDVCHFADVSKTGGDSLYPDNYVAAAASHGIVQGTGANRFSPYESLTRLQLISTVVRAIDCMAEGPLPPPTGGLGTGWGRSDPDHGECVYWAECEGLLTGLPLTALDPSGFATRGEVAQVLHNFGHNVRYFGAKGDGVTDDSQAITHAMAFTAGVHEPLHFSAGRYLLCDQLAPPDGSILVGAGPSTVLHMPEFPSHSLTFIFLRTDPNNVTIRDMTLRGDGPTMNQGGLYLSGARDCTLSNVRFEDLWYGMKLGDGYRAARNWTIEDILATNCRMPMYIQDVEDSAFNRMLLQGVRVDRGLDHCIYMSEGCHRLTFSDVTLVGGGGYCLHLYSGTGGTSTAVAFNNLEIEANEGSQPITVTHGFSDIKFSNMTMRMRMNQVCVRVSDCTDVFFDEVRASGGYAFIGTFDGDTAGRIVIRNARYEGPTVLSPKRGEQGIRDLLVEDLTLDWPE